MEVTRIFDLLDYACEKYPRPDCLVAKVDGQWKPVSTREYRQMATWTAYGLLALGVKKGGIQQPPRMELRRYGDSNDRRGACTCVPYN